MKTDWEDNKLQQLFAELRAADERRTPAFARIVRGMPAQPEPGRSLLPVFRLAAVATVLVGSGLWLWTLRQTPLPQAAPPLVLISQWESPTDFLLETSSLALNSSAVPGQNQ